MATDQLAALAATVALAEGRGMPLLPGNPLGLAHLRTMLATATGGGFPPDKLGRWLGWAQCAVVAANVGVTLDDMRALTTRHTT